MRVALPGGEIARTVPSTEPQREIIASAYMSDEANTAFNEAVSLRVSGPIDSRTIEGALHALELRAVELAAKKRTSEQVRMMAKPG